MFKNIITNLINLSSDIILFIIGPKGFIQSFVDRIYEVHVRMNGKSMTYEEHVIFEIAHQYMAVFFIF